MSDSTAVLADGVDAKLLLRILGQVKADDFTRRMPVDTADLLAAIGPWLPAPAQGTP